MSEPDPTRVVADADVLAADLLVGGSPRDALDILRSHDWMVLVGTETLLDDAQAIIADLADASLAADWRERVEADMDVVDPSARGNPAFVAAHESSAATILSMDETLQSAGVGATIRPRLATSIKSPAAFARMVDPPSLYEAVFEEDYPGADREPDARSR